METPSALAISLIPGGRADFFTVRPFSAGRTVVDKLSRGYLNLSKSRVRNRNKAGSLRAQAGFPERVGDSPMQDGRGGPVPADPTASNRRDVIQLLAAGVVLSIIAPLSSEAAGPDDEPLGAA